VFEALSKLYDSACYKILFIIQHFVKTEPHMGICVKAIAKAISDETDVYEVFRNPNLQGERISAYKMTELVRKLSDYKYSISKEFFNSGVILAHAHLL
jgi:hypothetical protein